MRRVSTDRAPSASPFAISSLPVDSTAKHHESTQQQLARVVQILPLRGGHSGCTEEAAKKRNCGASCARALCCGLAILFSYSPFCRLSLVYRSAAYAPRARHQRSPQNTFITPRLREILRVVVVRPCPRTTEKWINA